MWDVRIIYVGWLMRFQQYWVKHLANLQSFCFVSLFCVISPYFTFLEGSTVQRCKRLAFSSFGIQSLRLPLIQKKCCFHKSIELDSHDLKDIQPSCSFNMFGIDLSPCTEQDGDRYSCWCVDNPVWQPAHGVDLVNIWPPW